MNLELLYDIIGYLGIGSTFLPILLITTKYKIIKSSNNSTSLIVLSVFYFLMNFTIFFFYLNSFKNQDLLVNIYLILEFILIVIFYYSLLSGFCFKLFFKLLIPIYLLVITISLQYFNIFENSLILNVFQKVTLLVLSLVYLFFLFKTSKHENLYESDFFWINTAVLIFNASTIYLSIFENFLRSNQSQMYYVLWPIFQVSGIVYFILFTIGLWKLKD